MQMIRALLLPFQIQVQTLHTYTKAPTRNLTYGSKAMGATDAHIQDTAASASKSSATSVSKYSYF
jgi:hypothetical protein